MSSSYGNSSNGDKSGGDPTTSLNGNRSEFASCRKAYATMKEKHHQKVEAKTYHPNDKDNKHLGRGYKILVNRKNWESTSFTVKTIYGQKHLITTTGMSSSSKVVINTPVVTCIHNKGVQTSQIWCEVHQTNHEPCMTNDEMIEEYHNAIICPTCNGQLCPRGNQNMCLWSIL